MQKILVVSVGCILGGLLFCKVSHTQPVFNEVMIANVEALADIEWAKPPTNCRGFGDYTCPNGGEKVDFIYEGYSLDPDEETY